MIRSMLIAMVAGSEAVGPGLAGSRRVLIVDEHALSRAVLTAAFQLRGHVCRAVATVAEALLSVDVFAPDIAIIEWNFRDGSGRQLSRRLRTRSTESGRPLRVIALSALDEPHDFRLDESIDAYFVKPTHSADIEAAFDR